MRKWGIPGFSMVEGGGRGSNGGGGLELELEVWSRWDGTQLRTKKWQSNYTSMTAVAEEACESSRLDVMAIVCTCMR